VKLSVLDQSPISEGSSAADALRNSIALACHAERWGYTRYWAAEHHAMAALASPAPEILLANIAAQTQRIRLGSGGIMLPHYSALKVAEVFSMLNALSPDRIDLGIGRAPGGGPLEAFALRREREDRPMPDDFADQLSELLAYLDRDFAANHPFGKIKMSTHTPPGSIVWLLGSSLWSAAAAAQLGLPYAFAHFFSGEDTREAMTYYQSRFVASKYRDKPEAAVAVGVVCADTQSEAQTLASSWRLMRQRLRAGGDLRPIAAPSDALRELGTPDAPNGKEWPAMLVGTPALVAKTLKEMAVALGIEEMFIVTATHDPEARLKSYELLARELGLGRS
jgi:luciferase family oxidoreductase group 1